LVFDRTESIRSFLVPLPRYAGELEPLFRQYSIPCTREAGPESATLVFDPGTDRGKVEETLLGMRRRTGREGMFLPRGSPATAYPRGARRGIMG
jgi:hypothetical protein